MDIERKNKIQEIEDDMLKLDNVTPVLYNVYMRKLNQERRELLEDYSGGDMSAEEVVDDYVRFCEFNLKLLSKERITLASFEDALDSCVRDYKAISSLDLDGRAYTCAECFFKAVEDMVKAKRGEGYAYKLTYIKKKQEKLNLCLVENLDKRVEGASLSANEVSRLFEKKEQDARDRKTIISKGIPLGMIDESERE